MGEWLPRVECVCVCVCVLCTQVQAITLYPEPFSVENDLLTPTFKLKRPQAKAKFLAAIDAMYASLPASS